MDIRSLGYIEIEVTDLERWREYAEILGSMLIATEDGFQMKIDERPFRVAVRSTTDTEGLAAIGWELPDSIALESAEVELAAAGFTTKTGSDDECAERLVRGLIRTDDANWTVSQITKPSVWGHRPPANV